LIGDYLFAPVKIWKAKVADFKYFFNVPIASCLNVASR